MQKIPSTDSVFHHIEKQIYSELQIQLGNSVNFSCQMAQRRTLFGKYTTVAIDIHDIPYMGRLTTLLSWVASTTSYCYKYATIDLVEKNQRLTLKAIPLTQLSNDNASVSFLFS